MLTSRHFIACFMKRFCCLEARNVASPQSVSEKCVVMGHRVLEMNSIKSEKRERFVKVYLQ